MTREPSAKEKNLKTFIQERLQVHLDDVFSEVVKKFPNIVTGDWSPENEIKLSSLKDDIEDMIFDWAMRNVGPKKGSLEELRVERNRWLMNECNRTLSDDGFHFDDRGSNRWVNDPYEDLEGNPCFPEEVYGNSYLAWRDLEKSDANNLLKKLREFEALRDSTRAGSKR
jgi:hypothetical protein